MSSATWLDEAIAFFAPGAAARRLRARNGWQTAKRAYDGAAAGHNVDGWKTGRTSADAEIASAGGRLRSRSRDLVRNSPYAAKAISVLAGNIIGEGILPRANTGNPARDKAVNVAFDRWSKECDADGQLDFFGMQTLAVREMIEGGEVLCRRRWRQATDGLHVPLQIQLLESDYLDDSRTGEVGNGNISISGIEFDAIGRRAAYWLWPQHPGNNFSLARMSLQSKAVPASEIAHLYEKQRTQSRGVTWFAPVVRRSRDEDDYDFAEGIRKKIEASTVAFVTSEEDDDRSLGPRVTDSKGNVLDKIAPGLIALLRGGKDVKFNQPATVGGYEEYKRVSARQIAAGLRIPYELLTGDLSNVNFSSARVGIVEFRRFCSIMQWQVIIPMALQPWWDWFCESAYLAGVIDSPDIPVEWSPPKWQAIDPYKDALADLIVLRSGTRSWPDVAAQNGRDPDQVLAEIAAWNKKVDGLGIILDSDPRRVTMAGVLQALSAVADDGNGQTGAGNSGSN